MMMSDESRTFLGDRPEMMMMRSNNNNSSTIWACIVAFLLMSMLALTITALLIAKTAKTDADNNTNALADLKTTVSGKVDISVLPASIEEQISKIVIVNGTDGRDGSNITGPPGMV